MSFSGSLIWNEECYHLPFVGGFSYVGSSKALLCVSLEVESGPGRQAALLFNFLLLPPLCISSFPRLAAIGICPLELRESHGDWSLYPTSKKWGTQKGFYAQEPHRSLLCFSF